MKAAILLILISLLQSCENYRSVNNDNIVLIDGDRIITNDTKIMTGLEILERDLKSKNSYDRGNSLFMDLLDIFF